MKAAMSPEEREAVERELGFHNRKINDIQGERFGGFFQEGSREGWSQVFRRMVQDVLEDGKDRGVPLPFSYEGAEREADRRMDVLAEVTEPRLVHWDLWDGNVFVRDGRIVGFIDFERALWGDPLMEYYWGRLAVSPAFRRGYGEGELTEAKRVRRKLYDFYLDLILLIECAYRGYANEGHRKWAYDNCERGWRFLHEK